ncbi:hypothetical protein INT46_000099, partial [Mucor plumbeus]
RRQENKSPALYNCTNAISNLEDQRKPMEGSSIDKSSLCCNLDRKDWVHLKRGYIYTVMDGLCTTTAQNLKGDITRTEFPMGTFVFFGILFIGTCILVALFINILFYSAWKLWNKNLRDEDRSKIEKYIVYALEYLGFIVRAGFLSIVLMLFGLFAVLNAYYKYFLTPPPSQNYAYNEEAEPRDTTTSSSLKERPKILTPIILHPQNYWI